MAVAAEYGWQVLRIALATQLLVAGVLALAARPIATAFGTRHVDLAVTFVRVFGLGVAGFSISRTMRGSLRGAGDTTWPFYGTFTGTYLVKLPIAALALPVGYTLTVGGPIPALEYSFPVLSLPIGMGLGLGAVYVAICGNFYTRAAVNAVRFRSETWKTVARRSAVGRAGDD